MAAPLAVYTVEEQQAIIFRRMSALAKNDCRWAMLKIAKGAAMLYIMLKEGALSVGQCQNLLSLKRKF